MIFSVLLQGLKFFLRRHVHRAELCVRIALLEVDLDLIHIHTLVVDKEVVHQLQYRSVVLKLAERKLSERELESELFQFGNTYKVSLIRLHSRSQEKYYLVSRRGTL